MCVGCKELTGWPLDVYTAGLDVLDQSGFNAALVFLVRMDLNGPERVYARLAPMIAEHAKATLPATAPVWPSEPRTALVGMGRAQSSTWGS